MVDVYDLDRVIEVENPLEPEKGGYYKAFMQNYHNMELSGLDTKNFSLKPHCRESSIAGDDTVEVRSNDIDCFILCHKGNLEYAVAGSTVLSLDTCEKLGLEAAKRVELNNDLVSKDIEVLKKENWNTESISKYVNTNITTHIGIAALEFTDPEFYAQLLDAAKLNNYKNPEFNDTKYEDLFKKMDLALDKLFPSRSDQNDFFHEYMASPMKFRSEDFFLRTAATGIATVITNRAASNKLDGALIDPASVGFLNTAISKDEDKTYFVKDAVVDITAPMIAAQFKVPTIVNDVALFKSKTSPIADLKSLEHPFFEKIFKFAYSINDYFKELQLSKDIRAEASDKALSSSWNSWKEVRTKNELISAIPSLKRLCQEYKVEPSKENVMKALDSFVKDKQSSLEDSKEHHRDAFKSDEPLSKGYIGKTQEKAAKEPMKGTREAAKSMER